MDSFIRSLPLVASALGRKYGLQVIIGGSEAGTDGRTIRLPRLPLDSPPELVGLARGYLDHEAAHIRATDMPKVKRAGLSDLEHHIWNIIEDWRVEKVLGGTYPGCRSNFQWLIRHLFVQTPVDNQAPPDADLLNWLLFSLRSWNVPELEPKVKRLRRRLAIALPALMPKLESIVAEIKAKCPDTQAAIDYSRRIVKILQDAAESSPANQMSNGVVLGHTPGSPTENGSFSLRTETQPAGGSPEQPETGSDSAAQSEPTDPPAADQATESDSAEQSEQTDPSATDQATGSDSASQSEPTDPPTADQADKTDSQAESQPSNQDPPSQADPGQAVLKSLLKRPAKELPSSIGELLAQSLNEAEKQETSGFLEVAQVSPRDFSELSPADLQEARSSTLALGCRLQNLLQTMTLKRVQPGRRGRLDPNRLAKLSVGEPRVFRRSSPRIGLDTAIHLLLDASSSMSGSPIDLVSLASYSLSEAFKSIPGVSLGATFFPGDKLIYRKTKRMPQSPNWNTVAPLLEHGQKPHSKFSLCAKGSTPLGEALWWVMQNMSVLREKRKLILILTDGEPDSRDNALAAIKEAGRQGFEVYGLGLGNDSIKRLMPGRSQVIQNLAELPVTLFQLLGKAMSIKTEGGGQYGKT